uniref:Tropomodulin n=1 Tax=Romanomermis culicivorax TaxID=13658 RepID=A0A915IVD9_ROMCU
MPPSQRCREQTKKQPTGPYKREYLKRFLEVQAKKQEDWKETVAFEAGTKRGRIWIPKETTSRDVESEDFDIELDDENIGPTLKGAREQDWIDLAGILGLHSLLNQTQYYNALAGKQQDPDDMSFTGIVKCMRPKKKPPEDEHNDTSLDDCVERLNNNDEKLTILNLNNLKEMLPRPKLKEILQAMCNNKHVKVFSLANTSCNDQDLEPLFDVLEKNDALRSLNIESNFLSGIFLAKLVGHLSNNKSLIELKAENQKSASLGYTTEMEITEHVEQNDNLLRLGLSLRFMDSRHRIDEALERNYELVRLRRKNSSSSEIDDDKN